MNVRQGRKIPLCLAAALWPVLAPAVTLDWQGLTWHIAEGPGVGGNPFSDSTNCVWIDESDRLHLKTAFFSNAWHCAEIQTADRFHYGEFRFIVESSVPDLDTNLVVGLFLFNPIEYIATRGAPEVDIEFARRFLGMSAPENSQYGLQPTILEESLVETNVFAFTTPSNTVTTHRFIWTNSEVYYHSYTGDGEPGSGTTIAEYTRSSNSISGIPTESMRMRLYLNNWLFQNTPPADPQHTEVIIRSIITPSVIPERNTSTNNLETFEDKVSVSPAVTNTLLHFENGVTGWAVTWNPAVIEPINSGTAHTGTNALRIRKKYNPAAATKNWSTNGSFSISDWSDYDSFSYWARTESAGHGADSLKIGIFSSSTAAGYQQNAAVLSNAWQKCSYDLTDDYILDGLNLSAVTHITVESIHATLNSTNIYIDDLELTRSARTITNTLWHIGTWNSEYGAQGLQTSNPGDGTYALCYHQNDYPSTPLYNCVWTTNLAIRNWSEYNKITFLARHEPTSPDTNHWVRVQFIQGDGNFWVQDQPFYLSTNWTRCTVDLDITPSGFAYGGGDWDGTNNPPWHTLPFNRPDPAFQNGMNNVYALRFIFCNNSTNATDYLIDDLELVYEMGDAILALNIPETGLGFGDLAPSRTAYRFLTTNAATVNFTAENVYNWQMFVYTDNNDRRPGLQGIERPQAENLPLRAWAGTGAPPETITSAIWTNLLSIPDAYGDKWPIASSALANTLPSGFTLFLATEVYCAHTQHYAAPVVIELQAE